MTTSRGWNTWFADETVIRLNDDGSGEIRFFWKYFGNDQVTIEDGGKILEAIPNRRPVFQWSPGEQPTTVAIDLEPHREGEKSS